MMINFEQYARSPVNAAQACRFWSAHVDALDRHLSVHRWALVALTVVLISYPIARIVIPAALQIVVVPDAVRTVFNII